MANNLNQVISDDTTVTEQFFDTMRGHHLTPERDLLIAILEDAIYSYRTYRGARDGEGKENFREAEEWIMKARGNWIFSFNSICELLGLDPDYIRRRLRESDARSNNAARHGVNAGNPHQRVKRPSTNQIYRSGQ